MRCTVKQAKTNMAKLIKAAESGKEVVITRGKQPVAKMMPIAKAAKKRVPGRLKGLMWAAPDAFDPLTDEELREWGLD